MCKSLAQGHLGGYVKKTKTVALQTSGSPTVLPPDSEENDLVS